MQGCFFFVYLWIMMNRLETGREGENIALRYLLKRGLTLCERNWRTGHLEIDLIMENNISIHFIEVRSLQNSEQVFPRDTVIKKKQKRIIRAAASYIYKKRIAKEVIFDIVSVVFSNNKYEVEYIENAFLPM